jgi:hypothetical protein
MPISLMLRKLYSKRSFLPGRRSTIPHAKVPQKVSHAVKLSLSRRMRKKLVQQPPTTPE